MKIKLYELPERMEEISSKLIESEGELTPEIQEMMDALESDFGEKLRNIDHLLQELETSVSAMKEHRDKINKKIKTLENSIKNLKNYVLECMNRANLEKFANCRVQTSPKPSINLKVGKRIEEVDPSYVRATLKVNYGIIPDFLKQYAELELDKECILSEVKDGNVPDFVDVNYTKYVRFY